MSVAIALLALVAIASLTIELIDSRIRLRRLEKAADEYWPEYWKELR